MKVLGRFVVVAAFGSLCWIACGGDSEGGDDGVALCKDRCAKWNACFADAGGGSQDCNQQCAPRDGDGGGMTCTNQDAINSAVKACMEKSCDQIIACFQTIPGCQGGTSSGGTGGTGGSTGGTGGSGGTGGGGGGTCADLLACCNASTNEMLKMQCMATYNAALQVDAGNAACGTILSGIKSSVCP